MSFTMCTVTHSFENIDGTPGSGTVSFWLSKRMTNGTQTFVPSEVGASIASDGSLSQALPSNADPDTIPADAMYRVDIRVQGAEQESFFITVPATASVDLGTLLPQQPLGG